MNSTCQRTARKLTKLIIVGVSLLTVLLALFSTAPVQAAGVVTDCSSPVGSNGLYTKLGGGGPVTFNCPWPGPTVITVTVITPAGNTTLDGSNNGHPITLSGGGFSQLIHNISGGITLTLMHMTLRDGNAGSANGGCILNDSDTVVLIDVTLTHREADTKGGAIMSAGPLKIYDSLVTDNKVTNDFFASEGGGGILATGSLVISNTRFLNNQSYVGGGVSYPGGTANLTNVTFSGNSAHFGGGMFAYADTVNMTSVTFSGNFTTGSGGAGGGFFAESATATLSDTTFSTNSSPTGAGLILEGSEVNLNGVTLNGNTASDKGGGLYTVSGAVARLTNVTVSGNHAAVSGGGIENLGATYLGNVTVSGNSAPSGGGLWNNSGATLVLSNTIVAYSPTGGNCSGAVTSAKYSIDSDNTCGLTLIGPGNVHADPLLTALGNYGGPTLVHMPKTGSPAIDTVVGNDAPLIDQRGFSRPVGPYDVGAVERHSGESELAPRLYLPTLRR